MGTMEFIPYEEIKRPHTERQWPRITVKKRQIRKTKTIRAIDLLKRLKELKIQNPISERVLNRRSAI